MIPFGKLGWPSMKRSTESASCSAEDPPVYKGWHRKEMRIPPPLPFPRFSAGVSTVALEACHGIHDLADKYMRARNI